MSTPRRHHYNPLKYILFFCKTNSKGVPLFWVYENNKKKWRGPSQPINESLEKDFQKMDHFIDLDPYYLEKIFSSLEGDAISLIRKIFEEKRFPRNLKHSHPLINLMGLLAGRTPAIRDQLIRIKKQNALNFIEFCVSSEENYNQLIKCLKKNGETDEPVPYKKALSDVRKTKFNIEVDRSLIVEDMIKVAATLVDMLLERHWMVLETSSQNSQRFICSNNPVNIIWAQGFSNSIPGYNLYNTLVTFPLSPQFALLGSFSPLPDHSHVNDKIVEATNWCTAAGGATVLYSSEKIELPSFGSIIHLQEFHRLLPTRLLEYSDYKL